MDDLTRGPIQRAMNAVWTVLGAGLICGTAIALLVYVGRKGGGMHGRQKPEPKKVERTDPFVLIAQAIKDHADAMCHVACAIEKLAASGGAGGAAQDQEKINEATARLRSAKGKLDASTEANTSKEGE